MLRSAIEQLSASAIAASDRTILCEAIENARRNEVGDSVGQPLIPHRRIQLGQPPATSVVGNHVRLYKSEGGGLQYHEAWISGAKIMEHWGRVGDRGEIRIHDLATGRNDDMALRRILEPVIARGFSEARDDEWSRLTVTMSSCGGDSILQVAKRHAVEDRLDQVLGWTGLGWCDGGSTGSDGADVDCTVINCDIAEIVVKDDLKDTDVGTESRILCVRRSSHS
jgi:predicted DNA-binding WGR domain protein